MVISRLCSDFGTGWPNQYTLGKTVAWGQPGSGTCTCFPYYLSRISWQLL